MGWGVQDRVSCGSVWSPNCCVAETVLQFLILLPLPPESQDFIFVQECCWSAFAGDVMNSGEVGESVCGLQKVKVLGRQVKLGVQMTSLGRSFTCNDDGKRLYVQMEVNLDLWGESL